MPSDWASTNCDMGAVLQATADAMKGQLDVHNRAANTLLGNIRMLENKVSEAATKKETLKARAITAQVTALLGLSFCTNSPHQRVGWGCS
jgi:phage shock protein A